MPKRVDKQYVLEVFTRLRALNPSPTTELEYGNNYQLLVAVVLSAQATDKGVNKATRPLFQKIKTPAQMVKLGEEKLREAIKTIGLFRAKAKNVFALSQLLVAEHHGEIPRTREALMLLPGVGRKTANVVLNTAFGEPTLAVDTHVMRVAQRLGFSKNKTPEKVEEDALKIIPALFLRHAHHWLILHGRYTCTARVPKCSLCVLKDICPSVRH